MKTVMREIRSCLIIPALILYALSFTACGAVANNATDNINLHDSGFSAESPESTLSIDDEEPSDLNHEEHVISADNPDYTASDEQTEVLPEEENVSYSSILADKIRSFNSIEELDEEAELVLVGKCISAEPVFQNKMLYTLSKIKVEKVYKGDVSEGDAVLVYEVGGRVTSREYMEGHGKPEKVFLEDPPDEELDKKIILGINGYYPFREGERTLLFFGRLQRVF